MQAEQAYFEQFIGDYDPVIKWVAYNCGNGKEIVFDNRENALDFIIDSLKNAFPYYEIDNNAVEGHGGQFWTVPFTRGHHKINFLLERRSV
jgi:hypothetical protein